MHDTDLSIEQLAQTDAQWDEGGSADVEQLGDGWEAPPLPQTRAHVAIVANVAVVANEATPDVGAALDCERLAREERWSELIEALEREAADCDDEAERSARLAKIARVHERLGEVELATATWRRLLHGAPEHVGALRALVDCLRAGGAPAELAAALDALLDRAGRLLDDEETSAALSELAALRAGQGDWASVVELRGRQLAVTVDPSVRRSLYHSIASLLADEFDDAEQAIDVMLAALHESPDDGSTAERLELLARWDGAWGKLIEVARSWLDEPEIAGDTRAQVAVLLHLARWYANLGRVEWTIDCLEQACTLERWDVRPHLALGAALDGCGRRADARAVLENALHQAADRGDRRDVAVALARSIADDDPPAAVEQLRYALELDPEHVPAMRALVDVLDRLQAWAPALELLERLVARTEASSERVALLRRIASLRETHFLDADGASRRLEEVLEIDPSDDAAYVAIARCYVKLRLWDAAVHAHERHVEATSDDGLRAEAYATMGRLCEVELAVVERAIEAHGCALELRPTHLPSLEALARLYERQGEHGLALGLLRRWVDAVPDVSVKVPLLLRIARLAEERLLDRPLACAAYRDALALEPECASAMVALRRAAEAEERWADVAALLDREQRSTPTPRARARLLVELGTLRRDRLDDPRGALHAFEQAHAFDPEQEDAAWAVLADLVERHDWLAAEPLLARLARTAGKRSRLERNRIFSWHGRALEQLGRPKRAMEAFTRALQAMENDPDARRGLAETAWTVGDFAIALPAHQRLLASLGEDDEALRAQTLYRLGAIHRALGDGRKAIAFLQRASEVDVGHVPALRALAELHSARGAHRDAIEAMRRQVDVETDPRARASLLCAIADAWRDALHEPLAAVEALVEAADACPTDRTLLHRLLAEQDAAQDWDGACATIDRVVALDDDPSRIARYLSTAAQLRRDRLEDPAGALATFERALDADPTQLGALGAIVDTLGARGEWRELAGAYRRMLARIDGHGRADLEHSLWHALGCLLRDRIGDPVASGEALRRASRLRPDDSQDRQLLAQVYQASDRTDLAIDELQQAIERDPRDVPTLRALHDVYARCGMDDRASAVAAALVFLDGADRDQRRSFEAQRARGLPAFRATLDDATYARFVAHPMQHADVDGILAAVAPIARRLRLEALRARRSVPPPSAMKLADPVATPLPAVQVFFGLARVLQLGTPTLYVAPDAVGTIGLAPTDALASVLGASCLGGLALNELAFAIGKHLVVHRPEHLARATFQSLSELHGLVGAAIALGRGERDPDAQALRAACSQDREAMIVAAVRRTGEAAPDVQRWLHGAELTAVRVGLVLCGDLAAAAKMVRQEPVVPGAPTTSARLRELIRFAVSADLFEVRAALGIAPRASGAPPQSRADDDDEPTIDRRLCA